MKTLINLACLLIAVSVLVIYVPNSSAYDRYSVDDDSTNCRACHGDFRAGNYVSLSDGQDWGNLHNLHRTTMLNSDCDTCHGGDDRFPVILFQSDGGNGFSPISCMGCHGRDEDMGNDSISDGRGAGLRQHHTNAGINVCGDCHSDALPVNYTPVGEDVMPPYYFSPDANHPNKPTAPCNANGEEDYAGIAEGLDNDGDGFYDGDDPDCAGDCDPTTGDANGDGCVDFADVLDILSAWGDMGEPGILGDANCDGEVSFSDILLVLGTWGEGCG